MQSHRLSLSDSDLSHVPTRSDRDPTQSDVAVTVTAHPQPAVCGGAQSPQAPSALAQPRACTP